MTQKRDYRKEYDTYAGTEEQKKRRAARNQARRVAIREGRAKKGDGKEVDHKNFNPLDNRPSNVRVISAKSNRSRQPKRK
jgi:hypothetical protein